METKEKWLLAGYELFAYNGPQYLKIEKLGRIISKNKSSFYHHFADMEIFINKLLIHHLKQIQSLGDKENEATSFEEFVQILYWHKDDLFFNRQLRVHRVNVTYQQCFMKTNAIMGDSIMTIWQQILGLEGRSYLARMVLRLSVENFCLQINEETFSQNWLREYFIELQKMVREFKKGNFNGDLADGTV